MLEAMSEASAAGRVIVDAPPEVVYQLVSDVPRMSQWAVENQRNVWLSPDTEPRVGARFRGHNRRGWHRWSTTATVVAAQPGHLFAFRVRSFGFPVAVWAYDIHETPDGTEVTESMWYQAGFLVRRVLAPLGTGVASRARRIDDNRRNIARTLERLKAAAEAAVR
jgi:uncharacterized protein YndB with AHSA1/START domain